MSRTWYELLPNLNPDGTSLTNPALNANGYRAYRHSFNTGSNTSFNLFFRTNANTPYDNEQIVGIYKNGSSNNLLVGTTNIQSINATYIDHNSAGGSLRFISSNYKNESTTPDAILPGLDTNTTYFVISKTQWNDIGNGIAYELGTAFENNGVTSSFTYESTQNSAYVPPFNTAPSQTPSAPTITSVVGGRGSLTVYFTAPESDGGHTILAYSFSTDNGANWLGTVPISSPYILSGLIPTTIYQVKMRAHNALPGIGAESLAVSGMALGLPFPPATMSLTSGDGQLTVNFTAPSSDGGSAITSYELSTDNGANWNDVGLISSPYIITGLTNGTPYSIGLRAVTLMGDGYPSAIISMTPNVPLSAPTITSITSGNGSLVINFTAPVSNGGAPITAYNLSTDNGANWLNVGLISSPYTILSLTNGTSYQVKLRAINNNLAIPDRIGPASNPVSATPATAPNAPTILSVTAGNQQLSVTFTAPSSDGGSAITSYKISTDNGANWNDVGLISSPYIITGLTNGTFYNVRLLAVNSVGDGSISDIIGGTPVGSVPDAPIIDSIDAGDKVLFINYTAPTSDGGAEILGYFYSVDNGITWVQVNSIETPLLLTVADEEFTALINGTTYQVLIRAYNDNGDGASSNMIEATPNVIAMSSLKANGSDLVLNENDQGNYSLTLPEGTTSVTIEAIPVDSNLTVTITGADSLINNSYNTVECEIKLPSGYAVRLISIEVLVGTYTPPAGDFDPVPVEVNLNVNVDAQGNLEVFGEGKPTIGQYIIAEKPLPVDSLYDEVNKKGLIEIWEPSAAEGDIKAALANSDKTVSGGEDFTGAYKLTAKKMALGLEALLCDRFDCIHAAPFEAYTEVEYTTQRDFGRVALAAYAHALFGHVDATAAITNDKAFIEGMLSISAAGEQGATAAARAAAFTKALGNGTVDPMTWDSASSATDANLAVRLVQAIISKGVTSGALNETSVQAVTDINSDETLANIVRQVVGQDSNRLINVDFNERTKDIRQLLRFYAGDVIYVNITLQVPAVTIGAAYSGAMTGSSIASRFAEKNYTIKITLE